MNFNWITGWRLMMFIIVTVVSCFVIIGSAVSQVVPDKSGTELAARSVTSNGQPPVFDSVAIARHDEMIRLLQQNMQQSDSSLRISLEVWRQALTSNLQAVQDHFKSEAALHREQLEKELRQLKEQLKNQNDEQENKWQTYKENFAHSEKIVDWGLTLAAILLAVFGLVGIIVPLLLFREAKTAHNEAKELLKNTKAEVREQLQDTKAEVREQLQNIKAEVREFEERARRELDLMEKQAQTHLSEIEKNRDASSRILNQMSSETVSKNPDKSKVNAEKIIANPAASAKEKDFAEAYKLQASKNISAAITKWQKIIDTLALNKGDMSAVYYNLGYLFHEQKKWDEAIENYCAALALNPNDSSILYNRGIAYYSRGNPGDFDLALADYTKALELNPASQDTLSNRGLAYYSRGNPGDFDLALADYTKALELNPASQDTLSNRGLAYVRRNNPGDWDLALVDYTKAIELNPRDVGTYLNCLELMLIAGWLNKFDELLEKFRLTVPEDKIEPQNRIILQILLIIHLIIIGEPDLEQQTKLCEMMKIPGKLNWSFREIEACLANPNKLTKAQIEKIQALLAKIGEANLI